MDVLLGDFSGYILGDFNGYILNDFLCDFVGVFLDEFFLGGFVDERVKTSLASNLHQVISLSLKSKY